MATEDLWNQTLNKQPLPSSHRKQKKLCQSKAVSELAIMATALTVAKDVDEGVLYFNA